MRILAFTFVIAAILSAQQTRLVPSQYSTIQAAINASVNGDTVLVSPGTYPVVGLSYLGKSITVRSTGGPTVTTLDGANMGRIVEFANGEGPGAVLDGFRLYRGAGQINQPGGGIFIFVASPTIRNCKIESCKAGGSTDPQLRRGGGVAVGFGAPTFTNCSFVNNVSGVQLSPGLGPFDGADGGGFAVYYPQPGCAFTDCTFNQNQASPNAYSTSILLWGAPGRGGGGTVVGGPVTFSRCAFHANTVSGQSAFGGALWLSGVTATLEGCTFTSNSLNAVFASSSIVTATSCTFIGNSGVSGAGYAANGGGASTLVDCLFQDNNAGNSTIQTAGSFIVFSNSGGACYFAGVTSHITRCSFRGNRSGSGGIGPNDSVSVSGGIVSNGPSTTMTIENCSFWGNGPGGVSFTNGYFGNGTVIRSDGHVIVRHSTLYGNLTVSNSSQSFEVISANLLTLKNSIIYASGPAIDETYNAAAVSYSDIEGGYPGTGNIDADPQLVNPAVGDLRLAYGSPCIDQGSSSGTFGPVDLDGEPRVIDSATDMGADEYLRMGTPDDLRLTTQVNASGFAFSATKTPAVNDQVSVAITSPGGTYDGDPVLLVGQIYAVADPPIANVFYPFVFIDTQDPFTLDVIPSLSPLLGATFTFTVPAGVSGQVIRVQAFAVNPSAANGIFAATAAHDIVLP